MPQSRHERQEDDSRRYGRRGVARAVLEAETRGDEGYFDTHPIASEFRAVTPKKRLARWATEGNPTTSTGVRVLGMAIDDSHPKAARWP